MPREGVVLGARFKQLRRTVRILALAVTVCLLSCVASASAAGNLVANPSFEAGGFAPWTNAGAELIAGEAMPASRNNSAGIYQIEDGTKAVDLNGSGLGAVSQTIPTSPGTHYTLKYWMAANAYDPTFCILTPKKPIYTMNVVWNGKTVEAPTFDPNGSANGEPLAEWNMGWTQHSVAVIGEQAVGDALEFHSTAPDGPCGPTLDNVSVAAVQPPITITKLSPNKGPAAGGTTVTITGTNFTGTTAVTFGSVSATSFKVKSATLLTAVAPPEVAKAVDVTVTTPNGTSVISSLDHFKFGPPTVTKLSASSGSILGGATITVTGTGFGLGAEATLFKFATTEATTVNCISNTTCTVVVPSHAAGVVDVTATVSGQSSPKGVADQYTYS
jgi:hypothetical protein